MSKTILLPYQLPPLIIRALSGSSNDLGYDIVLDSQKNIYVAGETKSTVLGTRTAVLAKYNKHGTIQWQIELGSSALGGNTWGFSLAIDASDNLYLSGATDADINRAGGVDATLAKYDTSGNLQWQVLLGTSNDESGRALAVDGSGNVYLAGHGWGSGTPTGSGNYDMLLAKYDSSGTLQWQKRLGNATDLFAYGVSVDNSGNVIICGGSVTTTAVGPAFVAKYNSSGTLQWQKSYTGPGPGNNDLFFAVETDSSGNIYCSGTSFSIADSRYQGVLLKLNSSGVVQWQRRLHSDAAGTLLLFGISLDSSDNVYTHGYWDELGPVATDTLFVKYDNSGNIQWQNILLGVSAERATQSKISSDDRSLFFAGFSDSVGTIRSIAWGKIPTDGSELGTYPPFTYQASSFDDDAGSLVEAVSALSQPAPGLTTTAGTLTSQSLSLTPIKVV